MEQHLRSCPTAVRLSRAAEQPHFRASCNAGLASEAVPRPGRPPPASIGGSSGNAGAQPSGGGIGGKTSAFPTDNSQHNQSRPRVATPTNSPAGQMAEQEPEAPKSTLHSAAASAGMRGAEGGDRDGAGGPDDEGDCGIAGGQRPALGAELAWRLGPSALAQLLVRIQQAHAQVRSAVCAAGGMCNRGAMSAALHTACCLEGYDSSAGGSQYPAAWKLMTAQQQAHSNPAANQRAPYGMPCLRSPQ